MDPSNWERVRELYHSALECGPQDRAGFLDGACGGDGALRAELDALLGRGERAGDFLEPPSSADGARWATAPGEDSLLGRRIGRYTVREVLGSGGMGVVYEAEQDEPRRRVALKVVRGLPLLDDLTPRLFRREGQALARLQHPGIAAIYEAGRTEDGWHWFAMELVRGTPLTRYAREHGLGLGERLDLFQRVCEAVQYAHQRGVIHRDLKPSNILVADGEVEKSKSQKVESEPDAPLPPLAKGGSGGAAQPKVLDFGLARITDPDAELSTRLTDAGGIWGTLAYMSPEQARGRSDEIDVRSDVYALGVILYELLSGRLPYELGDKSLPEAARIIREDKPTPLRAAGFTPALLRALDGHAGRGGAGVNPAARLDADLETIVGKALEKEPSRRYASVSQLASDITHYLRNEPIAARPASALYQLRKLAARHKTPFILAGVLLLAIVSFGVIAAWQAVRISAERDRAVAAQKREAEARESAEEAASFLEKLFEQSAPDSQDPPNPTVRDVLDAGVARLDEQLADQPLIYARLAHALGVIYTRLAEYQRAEILIQSAIDIRRRELGERHPDVAAALVALARLFTVTAKHDAVHPLHLEVLEIMRNHFGGPHEKVAEALETVGCGYFYAGDNAAALDYLQQCLDMRRALNSPDRVMGMALQNLGYALQSLGRNDEAERALIESLDLKRRADRSHDCDSACEIGLSLEALAHVEVGRGNPGAAEEYCRQQVEAVRRGCAPTDLRIAWALNNHAVLVNQNRGPAAAEPLLREALAIRVAAFGEQHPDVATILNQLAQVRLRQDDPEGAIELSGKAVEIHRAVLGGNHDLVANGLWTQGQAYRRAEMPDEAEAALSEGYEILAANYGEASKESAGIVRELIAHYTEHGPCDLADEWRATLAQIPTGP